MLLKKTAKEKGLFPDPDRRIFINTEVCEGCGDCGIKSNCVSILPEETELGRNERLTRVHAIKIFLVLMDFARVSFRLLELRLEKGNEQLKIPDIPDITVPGIDKTYNIVVTGIGGTGVVTIGALLGMASHIEGKGAGVMEMAGLHRKVEQFIFIVE